MKYRLGLDVGTNSLGWAIVKVDGKENPVKVIKAGSRIFSDGRDDKSKATLKATRREARSARRRRDRFKQRQRFLIDELTKAGMFPEGEAEQGKAERARLQSLNPYELRANALSKKLELYEIGRALFHLNQRRGFQSNRIDRTEERVSGKVSESVRSLYQKMGLMEPSLSKDKYKELTKEKQKEYRQKEAEGRKDALKNLAEDKEVSFGKFLWTRNKEQQPTRARPGAGEEGNLYDVYPTRDLLKDEFNKIWNAQSKHYPKVLTDKVRKRIDTAIFTQRQLKSQKENIGRCSYMAEKQRAYQAMPSFQRYRIYQDVNNLEWKTARKTYRLIDYPEARDEVVELLEHPLTKNGSVIFGNMKKVLLKRGIVDEEIHFNFESDRRKWFDGNLTSNIMQDEECVGSEWHSWPLEKQDEFVDIILDDGLDDDGARKLLQEKYGLSEYQAENCAKAFLPDGTARLSVQAARLLIEKMCDEYIIQSEAVEAVASEVDNFISPLRKRGDAKDYKAFDKLPYYGEHFQDGSHIIPGTLKEENRADDLKYWGGVTNPTVHIALNQIRIVINELIDIYGHPHSISIELGRNLPAGKEGREKIVRDQTQGQTENIKLDEILTEHKVTINRENRLRLKLWKDLDECPTGRCCPFSGEKISIADIFSNKIQIEHLIPFSKSLDDSRANKVISTLKANQDKKNRTPFEAFGDSPPGYNWEEIFDRSRRLPQAKQWRFQEDALEIWNRSDVSDFSERHLNDTRYIGRLTREYLECICHIDKIDVLTGRLTALLRNEWGLNSVLNNEELSGDMPKPKNRDDHRHHAVDAVTIAMTTLPIIQKVARAAGRAEELKLDRLFEKGTKGKGPITPYDGFKSEVIKVVGDIVVSHKARKKSLSPKMTDGQLHEETAYGIVSGPNDKGQYEIVGRKPIDEFASNKKLIEKIRDKVLRKEFSSAFDKNGKEGVIELAQNKKIRNLRYIRDTSSFIPIKDKSGNIYKGYVGGSNWGIEIYEYPKGHENFDKWEGVVISRFEANQSDFRPSETKKPHPAARLVMRLQMNECVEIDDGSKRQIMRLQKMNANGRMYFAPHNEANVAARDGDGDDLFNFLDRRLNPLRKLNPRKVHVSPTGRVSYENRH